MNIYKIIVELERKEASIDDSRNCHIQKMEFFIKAERSTVTALRCRVSQFIRDW